MRSKSFASVRGLAAFVFLIVLGGLTLAAPAQASLDGDVAQNEPPPAGFGKDGAAVFELSWPPPETLRDDKDRQRRYRAHVETAVSSYQKGAFDDSMREYLSAYLIEPEPLLLFNAAQGQRKAQHYKPALALYEMFVKKAPRSEMVPEADANIASMRAKIEVERLAAERERLSTQITDAEEQARRRSEQAEAAARATTSKLEQENKALNVQLLRVKDGQPVYKKKWFWGVLGGSLAVVTGLAIGLGVALRPEVPDGTIGNVPVPF